MLFIFFHITSWHRATRSLTYDNFIVIQPNSHTHALSAFLSQPPRGTGKKSLTRCSLSPFILMHHVASVSPLYWSASNYFFFSRHHVAQSKRPRHTALSVVDRIFFFSRHLVAKGKSHQHTALPVLDRNFAFSTPPGGTEQMSSGNTLLYRSSTKFYLFHANSWRSKIL